MFGDICYQQIHDDYCFASYSDLNVIMHKTSGWINATKLCRDGGKLVKNWLRLEHTKKLINVIQNEHLPNSNNLSSAHIRADACKTVLLNRDTNIGMLLSGTYIHPDLIPSLAGWINPIF